MKYVAYTFVAWFSLAVIMTMYRAVRRFRRVNFLIRLMERETQLARKAIATVDVDRFHAHMNYRREIFEEVQNLLK